MSDLGPLTIYLDEDRALGLNNDVRFAGGLQLPDQRSLEVSIAFYRKGLIPLAPGIIHGSTHELAAWLITQSCAHIAEDRFHEALDALSEALNLLEVGQQFPNDPIWMAAIRYNQALCDMNVAAGSQVRPLIENAREILDFVVDFGQNGANLVSFNCVDGALTRITKLLDQLPKQGVDDR